MNASNAKRNQKTGVDLLNKTLLTLGRLPYRDFMAIKEFKDCFGFFKILWGKQYLKIK